MSVDGLERLCPMCGQRMGRAVLEAHLRGHLGTRRGRVQAWRFVVVTPGMWGPLVRQVRVSPAGPSRRAMLGCAWVAAAAGVVAVVWSAPWWGFAAAAGAFVAAALLPRS